MNRTLRVLLLALLFLSASAAGLAQGTGEISGTVRDQSGAVLPGAELSATQIQTGFVRSAVTNETGSYILPNLPIGPYKLEASLPGFRTYVQTGIILEVNSRPVINVALDGDHRRRPHCLQRATAERQAWDRLSLVRGSHQLQPPRPQEEQLINDYSCFRARTGSTAAARRAGITHAITEITSNSSEIEM